MTSLTHEQIAELHLQEDRPLKVIDPDTQKVYVIIADELFNRLRHLVDNAEFDIEETYTAQSTVAGAAGWDDPTMDAYDDYDRHKSQS